MPSSVVGRRSSPPAVGLRLAPAKATRTAIYLLFALSLAAVNPGSASAQSAPDSARTAPVDTLAVLLKGSLHVSELDPEGQQVAATAASPTVASSPAASKPRPVSSPFPAAPLPDTTEAVPEAALATLKMLNVKDADLRDVFRTIAHEHGLNLVVDNRIDRRVTIRLSDLPVIEALRFLSRENDLNLSQDGHILRVSVPPKPEPTPPKPPSIFVRDSLLTVDLREDDLGQVVRLIAQQSGTNIVVRRGVEGTLTGALQNVLIDQGLRTLLMSNGFTIRRTDSIYYVDRAGLEGAEGTTRAFWVQASDSLVSLDVVDARIADVLREIGAQMKVSLVTYDTPEERITARADSLTLDQALNLLLKRTSITYRKEGDLYFVGSKETSGIAETRLLRLNHLRADAALALLPDLLTQRATIQVVREHNGLMVTGTRDVIAELEAFIREIDFPTPQILIEALVVDFEASDLFELGLSFGNNPQQAAEAGQLNDGFDGALDLETATKPGLNVSGNGNQINDLIEDVVDPLASLFGVRNIGRLPANFFARIRALSLEGRANILSRPQISTLSGHLAQLKIGTTQYYILRTQTPYQNPNQVLLQNTQRFEKIEANVVLEITPWVSASGEITADIRPEFSMPVGEFDPDIPPTINTRVLESTVRLRDGETIILGGLIQDEERVLYNKVPVLGSVPLLGRLFRSTSTEKAKKELVIFLTPHVFYGDERDNLKWEALREEMNLRGLDDRSQLDRLIDRIK